MNGSVRGGRHKNAQAHARRWRATTPSFGLVEEAKELQSPARDQLRPHVCALCYFHSHLSSEHRHGEQDRRARQHLSATVPLRHEDARGDQGARSLAMSDGEGTLEQGLSTVSGPISFASNSPTAEIKRNLQLLGIEMLRLVCICVVPSFSMFRAFLEVVKEGGAEEGGVEEVGVEVRRLRRPPLPCPPLPRPCSLNMEKDRRAGLGHVNALWTDEAGVCLKSNPANWGQMLARGQAQGPSCRFTPTSLPLAPPHANPQALRILPVTILHLRRMRRNPKQFEQALRRSVEGSSSCVSTPGVAHQVTTRSTSLSYS